MRERERERRRHSPLVLNVYQIKDLTISFVELYMIVSVTRLGPIINLFVY